MVFGNFLHFLFVQNLDPVEGLNPFCHPVMIIGRLDSAEINSNLEFLFFAISDFILLIGKFSNEMPKIEQLQ